MQRLAAQGVQVFMGWYESVIPLGVYLGSLYRHSTLGFTEINRVGSGLHAEAESSWATATLLGLQSPCFLLDQSSGPELLRANSFLGHTPFGISPSVVLECACDLAKLQAGSMQSSPAGR